MTEDGQSLDPDPAPVVPDDDAPADPMKLPESAVGQPPPTPGAEPQAATLPEPMAIAIDAAVMVAVSLAQRRTRNPLIRQPADLDKRDLPCLVVLMYRTNDGQPVIVHAAASGPLADQAQALAGALAAVEKSLTANTLAGAGLVLPNGRPIPPLRKKN